jgi:hypothetical protein
MIYVLKASGRPGSVGVVLIGTAEYVATWRRELIMGKTPNGHPMPSPVFRKPVVVGMLEGDDDKAATIRAMFAPLGLGLIVATPDFSEWLRANTVKWNGDDAKQLGLDATRRSGRARVPAARRKTHAHPPRKLSSPKPGPTPGLGQSWPVPDDADGHCGICRRPKAPMSACLWCQNDTAVCARCREPIDRHEQQSDGSLRPITPYCRKCFVISDPSLLPPAISTP